MHRMTKPPPPSAFRPAGCFGRGVEAPDGDNVAGVDGDGCVDDVKGTIPKNPPVPSLVIVRLEIGIGAIGTGSHAVE